MRLLSTSLAALMLMATAACTTPQMGQAPDTQFLDNTDMPMPNRTDMLSASRPYLIGPFDKLNIDVFGVEELAREVQIDASGRLSFPLIGVVEAAGLTPGELAVAIETRLAGRFVRQPQVTVNLMETVSQVITVDGEVNEPGLYPVIGNMTLIRAVATAGGTTQLAGLENVVVFRTVGGQRYAGLYNLKAIRMGNYEDPEMYANDVIVVSESTARRLFRDLLTAAPLLTTPIIALTR